MQELNLTKIVKKIIRKINSKINHFYYKGFWVNHHIFQIMIFRIVMLYNMSLLQISPLKNLEKIMKN